MIARSICGFDQQIVSFRNRLRILDDRLIDIAYISGANELYCLSAVFKKKLKEGRA